jgi:DNA-binding NarL/FixJ family response regulator
MNRPTVLLADDHALIIEGLKALLESDFEIVGTVEDGRALVESAHRLSPDVIVTDVSMPRMNGFEAVRKIQQLGVRSKIIFLTMSLDIDLAAEAVRVGAHGYLLKDTASRELRVAIEEVLGGGVYVTPRVRHELLRAITTNPPGIGTYEAMSSKQREVLRLLAQGHTAVEIAGLLQVPQAAVETYKVRLKQVLKVDTIAELTQCALGFGILTGGPHRNGAAKAEKHA